MRCEEMIIPPYFRCPISLDLFKDPVTLWTGQTYDRSCIEKWLAAGNSTCPVTMQKLQDSSMVPNHTLRHLIHDWLQSNGRYSEQLDHDDDFSQPQISDNIARIKHVIESDACALESKIRALEEVHSLSLELPLHNSCLIQLNFFKILIECVFRNAHDENPMLVEKALSSALKLMPFSELGCLNMLEQESNYAVFLSLLEEGSVFIKRGLCLVIEAVSRELPARQLCEEKLGKSARVVRAIVGIVGRRESGDEAVEAGIGALSGLASSESSRANIASSGAVEALVACMSNFVEAGRRSAAALSAVEKLLTETSARQELLSHPSGVGAVVRMVFKVCVREGSESAVNSLLILCRESEDAREKVIHEGVLTQLLLLLQSQSSARIKTKGRMLLKLLRSN